jgi:hypothetical protein
LYLSGKAAAARGHAGRVPDTVVKGDGIRNRNHRGSGREEI